MRDPAAANLAHDLPEHEIDSLFQSAIAGATQATPSEADALHNRYSHPLSSLRMTGFSQDSRPAAALLAARLASTLDQRQQARDAALRLIGADHQQDSLLTHSLQVLADGLEHDVPFLTKQSWTLRCLAGHIWVHNPTLPNTIGEVLGVDPDFRVRRSLARELADSGPSTRTATIRGQLRADVRYSVRSLL